MLRDPAIRDALAIGLAVAVFGVTYGVLAVTSGLSVSQTLASSMLVFAGGAQFAFVATVGAGGSVAAAAAAGLMLNVRYLAFGLAIAPHLRANGVLRRALAGQLVTDESVSLALARREATERTFWVAALTVFVGWNVGTVLGALGGAGLASPEALGLDAAFPAGFLALLAPHLRGRQEVGVAVAGAVVTVATAPLLPAGLPLLAAALPALLAAGARP